MRRTHMGHADLAVVATAAQDYVQGSSQTALNCSTTASDPPRKQAMATLDTNRSYTDATIVGTISRFIAGIFTTLVSWNDARITRKSLSGLSNRELEDIGLTRADIDTIAMRGSR